MRHLQLQSGPAEIPNKRMMVGAVAGCVQARLDPRDQGIEPLANLGLFRLQPFELRSQFSQLLAELFVGHELILRARR